MSCIVRQSQGEIREHGLLSAFADFLRIDVANGDATPDTVRAYHGEVGAWMAWCSECGIEPGNATRADVESYREALKAKGMTVATRRKKLSVIRRFYAAGVKYALIAANPAEDVKAGKDTTAPEDRLKSLTQGTLATLIEAIAGDSLNGKRDRALIGLMALHGLRRVEVHRMNQ